MGNLEGKIALVTGSGRGIGRALALKLAKEGAKVVINDLDKAPVLETMEEIINMGGEARVVVGSVIEDGFAERFVQTAIDEFGGIDIIVNNAGYTWDSFIHKMSDDKFDAMLDVHLRAPFRILRAASGFIREAAMREAKEGREVFRKIVNISSISGLSGNMGQTNYSTAKAGVVGMTKTLSREWGRFKVNVNCVAFGFIETRLTKASEEKKSITVGENKVPVGLPPAISEKLQSDIPMGRGGTPEEAANGIYLFCTPESNYISGQVVLVGGGPA
jgi:3-oxoacyl-[acyl-carrier protein] reductase